MRHFMQIFIPFMPLQPAAQLLCNTEVLISAPNILHSDPLLPDHIREKFTFINFPGLHPEMELVLFPFLLFFFLYQFPELIYINLNFNISVPTAHSGLDIYVFAIWKSNILQLFTKSENGVVQASVLILHLNSSIKGIYHSSFGNSAVFGMKHKQLKKLCSLRCFISIQYQFFSLIFQRKGSKHANL